MKCSFEWGNSNDTAITSHDHLWVTRTLFWLAPVSNLMPMSRKKLQRSGWNRNQTIWNCIFFSPLGSTYLGSEWNNGPGPLASSWTAESSITSIDTTLLVPELFRCDSNFLSQIHGKALPIGQHRRHREWTEGLLPSTKVECKPRVQ